jgi:hypothetical protein
VVGHYGTVLEDSTSDQGPYTGHKKLLLSPSLLVFLHATAISTLDTSETTISKVIEYSLNWLLPHQINSICYSDKESHCFLYF